VSGQSDLRRIAEQLLILSERPDNEGLRAQPHGLRLVDVDPDYLLRLAEALFETRRLRGRHLDDELFREPAWDMLLDLFIQKERGRRPSVKGVCLASNVPATTALRWIGWLESEGLIERQRDERDRRRIFIALSRTGHSAIRQYLLDVTRCLRVVGGSSLLLVGSEK
jgi:DNA-binding MarR family transcriptional regulator